MSCRATCRVLSRQKQHDKSKSVRPEPLGIRQLKSRIARLSKRNFLEGSVGEPDNDQCGDIRPYKPREQVIHAPDGRLLRDPGPSETTNQDEHTNNSSR